MDTLTVPQAPSAVEHHQDPEMSIGRLRQLDTRTEQETTLYRYEYELTPSEVFALLERRGMLQKIEETDRAVLEKFSSLTLQIWGEEALQHTTELDLSKECILLCEGLRSDHREWEAPDCSLVHRLTKTWKARNPSRPCPTLIAVSCPGFGGSRLLDEKGVTPEDVSADSYASLVDVLAPALNAGTIVGHSAGGEAVLQSMVQGSSESDTCDRIALTPAVGPDRKQIFRLIDAAQRFGNVTDTLLRRVTSLGRDRDGGSRNRLVRGVEGLVTRVLVGSKPRDTAMEILTQQQTAARQALIAMHGEQAANHPTVDRAKLIELARPDDFQLERLIEAKVLPRVIYAENDQLTTPDGARAWVREATRNLMTVLDRFGLRVSGTTTSVEAVLENTMAIKLPNAGHDDAFVDNASQTIVVDAIIQTHGQRQQRQERGDQISKLLHFLQGQRSRPGQSAILSLVLDEGAHAFDDETLQTRLMQAETLLVWQDVAAEIQKIPPLDFENEERVRLGTEISRKLQQLIVQLLSTQTHLALEQEEIDYLPQDIHARKQAVDFDPELGELFVEHIRATGSLKSSHRYEGNRFYDWLETSVPQDFRLAVSRLLLSIRRRDDGLFASQEFNAALFEIRKLKMPEVVEKMKNKGIEINVNPRDLLALRDEILRSASIDSQMLFAVDALIHTVSTQGEQGAQSVEHTLGKLQASGVDLPTVASGVDQTRMGMLTAAMQSAGENIEDGRPEEFGAGLFANLKRGASQYGRKLLTAVRFGGNTEQIPPQVIERDEQVDLEAAQGLFSELHRRMDYVEQWLQFFGEERPKLKKNLSQTAYYGFVALGLARNFREVWKQGFWKIRLRRELPIGETVPDERLLNQASTHPTRYELGTDDQAYLESLLPERAQAIILDSQISEFFSDPENEAREALYMTYDGGTHIFRQEISRSWHKDHTKQERVAALERTFYELGTGTDKKNTANLSKKQRRSLRQKMYGSITAYARDPEINAVYGHPDIAQTIVVVVPSEADQDEVTLAKRMTDPRFVTAGALANRVIAFGQRYRNVDIAVAHREYDGVEAHEHLVPSLTGLRERYGQDMTGSLAAIPKTLDLRGVQLLIPEDKVLRVEPEQYAEYRISQERYMAMQQKLTQLRQRLRIEKLTADQERFFGFSLPSGLSFPDVIQYAAHLLGMETGQMVVQQKDAPESLLDVAVSGYRNDIIETARRLQESPDDVHLRTAFVEQTINAMGRFFPEKSLATKGESSPSFFATLAAQVRFFESLAKQVGKKTAGERVVRLMNNQDFMLSVPTDVRGKSQPNPNGVRIRSFFSAQTDALRGNKHDLSRDKVGAIGLIEDAGEGAILSVRTTPDQSLATIKSLLERAYPGEKNGQKRDEILGLLAETITKESPEIWRGYVNTLEADEAKQMNRIVELIGLAITQKATVQLEHIVANAEFFLDTFLRYLDEQGVQADSPLTIRYVQDGKFQFPFPITAIQ